MAKQKENAATPKLKLKQKEYEKELRRLQAELCLMQDSVKRNGNRIIIVFEGRDGAGKGGTIRAITERPARASSAWWRFPPHRIARKLSCTCSVILRTSLPLVKS